MRHITRILYTATILAMASPDIPHADNLPLTKIVVYRYGGAEAGAGLNQFDLFRSILVNKVQSIPGHFADLVDAEYLKEVSIVSVQHQPPQSVSEEYRARIQEHALQLLEGSLFERPSRGIWAKSRAFLGEPALTSKLQRDALVLELRISETEFASINDSHSIVILYALYLDASRLDLPKSIQARLLSRASAIISDLERRGDLQPDIQLVKSAVAEAATKLQRP